MASHLPRLTLGQFRRAKGEPRRSYFSSTRLESLKMAFGLIVQARIFGVIFTSPVRADQFLYICDRVRPSERQMSTESFRIRQSHFFRRLKEGEEW